MNIKWGEMAKKLGTITKDLLASLYVDESVIKYSEKSGFLLLAVGDALMEIKNTKGFKPKEW